MTQEELLSDYSNFPKEKITRIEIASSSLGDSQLPSLFNCPYLIIDRHEGNFAIMRATAYVDVRVDHVRNGVFNGSVWVAMAPNDTLSLRHNNDGLNYDGYSC
jgi:hypothetical protein